jgi:hypothetical protein
MINFAPYHASSVGTSLFLIIVGLLVISCGFDIIRSNPHEIARRNV